MLSLAGLDVYRLWPINNSLGFMLGPLGIRPVWYCTPCICVWFESGWPWRYFSSFFSAAERCRGPRLSQRPNGLHRAVMQQRRLLLRVYGTAVHFRVSLDLGAVASWVFDDIKTCSVLMRWPKVNDAIKSEPRELNSVYILVGWGIGEPGTSRCNRWRSIQ